MKLGKILVKSKYAAGVGVALIFVLGLFQNCSQVQKQSLHETSPNKSPLSPYDTKKAIFDSSSVKQKMIGGIDVKGFDVGSYFYAYVDDQCVMNRKEQILRMPIYLTDPFLQKSFNFAKPVATFDVSLIEARLTTFISEDNLNKAIKFDDCIKSLMISDSPMTLSYDSGKDVTGESHTGYWSDAGVSTSVLSQLSALNKDTKVAIGIIVPGLNPTAGAGINLHANIEGIKMGDPNGLGTYLTSLIAMRPMSGGYQGIAQSVGQIIPHPIGASNSFIDVYESVKDLVNRGAEVILIPQEYIPDRPSYCSPVVGEMLFQAVERGVTIVVQAGTATDGKTPGDIDGVRDFRLSKPTLTNFPACWSRYFRGVISVGAKVVGSDQFAPNSNFGPEGIEMLATGVKVVGVDQDSKFVKSDSPATSAALATAAVAHIISFYKSKSWFVSPWAMEDVLMAGSRASLTLPDSGKTVRLKRVLDFQSLVNFLTTLNSKTEQQARILATDNPEANQGIALETLASTDKPIKLDVYTKVSDVFVKDRLQFQASLYFGNGAVKVITDSAQWTSSDPVNFPVDSGGVVYPKTTGSFTLTVKDLASGLTGTYSSSSVDYNRITGQSYDNNIEQVYLIPNLISIEPDSFTRTGSNTYNLKGLQIEFKIRAKYKNGVIRSISSYATVAIAYNGIPITNYTSNNTLDTVTLTSAVGPLFGGKEHDLFVFYMGTKYNLKLFVEPYTFLGWFWDVKFQPSSKPGYTISPPPKSVVAVSETERKVYADVSYSPGKEALCTYANGIVGHCYGYPAMSLLWDRSPTKSSIFNDEGMKQRFSPNTVGIYNLYSELKFRGSGADETKSIDLKIEVLPLVLTNHITSMALDIRTNFVQNASPSGTHYPNQNQLTPACMALGYEIYKGNVDLGVDRYLTTIQGTSFSGDETVSFSSLGKSVPVISIVPGKMGVFLKEPVVAPLTVQMKYITAPKEASVDMNYQFTSDPMNQSLLSGASELEKLALTTIKALPPLPPLKVADLACLATTMAASGFKRGDGSITNPILICDYSDLVKLQSYDPISVKSYMLYAEFGNNVDLTSTLPRTLGDGSRTYFKSVVRKISINGNFYRIFNADLVDREAVFVLVASDELKNLVFTANHLTSKRLSLTNGTGENIYSYDNIFEADQFTGIAYQAKNCYSKNLITYSSQFQSIANQVLNSFSQDDVRYIGVPGGGLYSGLGSVVAYSGTSSAIVGGARISGVADIYCYKCYSKANITAANARQIGGIIAASSAGLGNIELGDSEATIISSGLGVVGGLIGTVDYATILTRDLYLNGILVRVSYGHIHIMNSSFSGSITTTGVAGGFIGEEAMFVSPIFSNSQMTGTLKGATTILGSYIGQMKSSCQSEKRLIKIKNVTVKSGLPSVGNYYGAPSSGDEALLSF